MNEVECAFDECSLTFDKNYARPNQKYCSSDCTVKANNKRAMERYNRRKAQRLAGGKRICATKGCGTILRKNNTDLHCGACEKRRQLERLHIIRKGILDA